MPYKKEDLAYAAGFYEGEGTINATYSKYTAKTGVRYTRRTPQYCINIGQTDREPLEKFMAAVGIGRIYGPYQTDGGKHQPHWQYRAKNFEEAQAIIAMLWPWLSQRRKEQAKAVLQCGRR